MDSKAFYSKALISDFEEQLRKKMQMTRFDIVVVADDNAYNFALEEKDHLFEGLPIVFLGVNNKDKALHANELSEVTGIIEHVSIKETIDIGLKLKNNAKTIYVIADPTPTGQSVLENFNNIKDEYPTIEFKILDTSLMTFDTLAKALNQSTEEDLILLLSLYRDQAGESFIFHEGVDFVLENSNAPVLHIYKPGIERGMIGGHVVGHFQQGYFAGQLVKDYFDQGSFQGLLVIEKSPNTYFFNAQAMRSFDLDVDDLPKESIVINDDLSFLEKYRNYIIAFLLLFILESLLIFYLLLNINKRRVYEKELVEANDLLEVQNEEIKAQYTELEETKEALETSRSRYILAFEGFQSGLFDIDFKKGTSYINSNWYNQYLKIKLDDTDDFSKLIDCMPKEDLLIYSELKEKILKSDDRIYDIEFFVYPDDSSEKRWILENGVITRDEQGKVIRVTGSHHEITHLKQNIQRIKELKVYDQLTKLYNRNALELHLKRVLSKSENHPVAVILIDLDNFKYINDQYGHNRGDEILKTLASRMMQNNVADYISRFGGDEFVLIINAVESIDELIEKLYEINYFIERKIIIESEVYHINASFGVVISPDHGIECHELIRKADLAMYQVKNSDNKWYLIYDDAISDHFEKKIKRIKEMKLGIQNNEFYMVYHPIIDAITGKVFSAESLMRWGNNGVLISPNEFIPLAEKSGLIYELGIFSILESIKCLKELGGNLNISINFSAIQLKDSNLMDVLEKTIEEYNVPYEKIIIEITETAVIEDFDETIKVLERMKSLGLRIALDDFGTGYSSLSYLTKLPVDILKVDKSFVQSINENAETMDLIEAIVAIAKNRDLKVVFEGVETKEQLRFLIRLGCRYAQGYYFHKPMVVEDLEKLI